MFALDPLTLGHRLTIESTLALAQEPAVIVSVFCKSETISNETAGFVAGLLAAGILEIIPEIGLSIVVHAIGEPKPGHTPIYKVSQRVLIGVSYAGKFANDPFEFAVRDAIPSAVEAVLADFQSGRIPKSLHESHLKQLESDREGERKIPDAVSQILSGILEAKRGNMLRKIQTINSLRQTHEQRLSELMAENLRKVADSIGYMVIKKGKEESKN